MSTADSPPKLKPNQVLALVVLMAEAREVTNNELKELAGFALTGDDNKKLESLGLVATDRSHRPFSHQLTDKGWRVVRELPSTVPPKEGGSAIRSLFTVLANVHRSLDRLQISHAEFFKQTADTTRVEALTVAAGRDVQDDIRNAYAELPKATGGWVGLADLRERLSGLDRQTMDNALRAMARQDGVRIIPVANSKSLQPRDRAAALRIGDEDNHALWIGPT
jgi:hypothetical protein